MKILSKLAHKATTFLKMPVGAKALFFINFGLSGVLRFFQLFCSHQRFERFYGNSNRMNICSTLINPSQIQNALKIKRAIRLIDLYAPWKANCLNQALLSMLWCRYFKLPYMLYIGLPKDGAPLDKKKIGHAWVTAGPVILSGGNSFPSHVVIKSYSNRKPSH